MKPGSVTPGPVTPERAGPCTALARTLVRVGALCGLAACVTTYEDSPYFAGRSERPAEPPRPAYAVPIAIPIQGPGGDPDQALVAEFYQSVLQRLHEAMKEGDLPQLEALLANYQGADLPPALLERVRGYRELAHGLRFSREAAARTKLVVMVILPAADAPDAPPVEAGAPALGAPLHLELQLPAGSEPVRLGGRDDEDPVGFLVAVTVEDTYLDGSTHSSSTHGFLRLPAAIDLKGDTVLRLPIDVDLPGANAVRRDVHARVDLMPGYVQVASGRCPVRQTSLAAAAVAQWPVGYGAVAAAPLAELRASLRTFEPKTFARAYLAAAATRGADRETAIELLLEQVRFGRVDQAQVAMAALRTVTGVQFLVGDRDAWLAWSRERR